MSNETQPRRRCRALFLALVALTTIVMLDGCKRGGVSETKEDARVVLTPPTPATPRINGAKIFGVRPGAPFLFQIAASGERPMRFSVNELPPGLSLDQETGRITGLTSAVGRHSIMLQAENARGSAERPFTIVVGDEIGLTPAMGWNSWNIWGGQVTQDNVRAAAHALVESGLRDHGWTYVNIDDGWQGIRGGEFNAIQPNGKFPNIVALADEIHSLGLKLGIYSSPWRATFNYNIGSSADTPEGRYDWIERGEHNEFFHYDFPPSPFSKFLGPISRWLEKRWQMKITRRMRDFGPYPFVRQDVAQWTAWGVDYLKYDWVPIDLAHADAMHEALAQCGRDIIYSISNNTSLAVAPAIAPISNSWRTSPDVKDSWSDVSGVGFTRDAWASFQRSGHFNDADMLVVGRVGWGLPSRPTKLAPNEQYTQMSLWCLLGSPLLIGCDLEKLDPFTLALLTNDEVIDVSQDSLGKQATRVAGDRETDVFAKPLEDGAWAIGLFNRSARAKRVAVAWRQIGSHEPHVVRDLWRQTDLADFPDHFETTVAPHGVVLLRAQVAR